MTYELIEQTVLTSSASSVTFSSITQDYRDLVLVVDAANDAGSRPTYVYINGDTGFNYYYVEATGDGSSTLSNSGVRDELRVTNAGRTFTTFGTIIVHQILDYSTTDKHKPILVRGNNNNASATPTVGMAAFRWANTAAITSLQIQPSNGNWVSGSAFSVYGIAS